MGRDTGRAGPGGPPAIPAAARRRAAWGARPRPGLPRPARGIGAGLRRPLLALSVLATVQFGTVLLGSASAAADPSAGPSAAPTTDPCSVVPATMQAACESGTTGGGGGGGGVLTDPLNSLARGCADAAQWLIQQLGGAINGSTTVNFADAGFLKQYAVVFAASSVLTLVIWLLAIVKRAVRGVSLGRAFSEAFGLLWLTVFASAFTPLALYVVVKVTDGISAAITSGGTGGSGTFLDTFANALGPDSNLGGGPVILIFVSLLSIAAAAVLWIELIIRAAMLYVGAVLGTIVYAGLVDRNLWSHVRRWAGLMLAIDLAKPIIAIVLSLATAVSSGTNGALSTVLSGLAIMFLSIFASAVIYRFVPGFGDDMARLHSIRRTASTVGPAAAIDGPATRIRQGIATHGSRSSAAPSSAGSSSGGGSGGAGAVSSGIAAHGRRQAPPPPPAPVAPPPAPRMGDTAAPPAPATVPTAARQQPPRRQTGSGGSA